MKRVLCCVWVLLFISGAVLAQFPPRGYIGLYLDSTRFPCHSCANGVVPYVVEMWIWCWPSYEGSKAASFMVVYPANVIQGPVTYNLDIIEGYVGDLLNGVGVWYDSCQMDWHWIAHQSLHVIDPAPSHVYIAKHPDPYCPCINFATCQTGYPIQCVTVHTELLLNVECPPGNPIGTERATWGAIKNQFN
jgi:hypothetical protein